ncbi:NUDIX domain-containing protein [Micromonospora haikouensis]|uniref:NUDIX domain-containing protein n=1 Tax=Micromonospora haikouensis TaxID=686309 RepID=UPI000B84F2CC|nr:NUDIX hydrolase [Micromonospora haikouensis]
MTWTEPATWYANLPAFYAATAAFITDSAGNILLVKPTYRDHWAFPGGYLEDGEFPHVGCAREVQEELGVSVTVGTLLVVDWASPAGERPRSLIHFTFDCGILSDQSDFDLPRQELEDVAFFPPGEAEQRLPDSVSPRIAAAAGARIRLTPVYLTDGHAPRHQSPGWEAREA